LKSRADSLSLIGKYQRMMEYGLGVVVPSTLAMMLFSYIIAPELLPLFFALSVTVAFTMILPARRIHALSFQCWTKNSMTKSLITSLIGMIYITEAAIFAVAMMSVNAGLDPQQPMTFAVFGGLMVFLIGVLAWNDQYKKESERTDKRYVKLDARSAQIRVHDVLEAKGRNFEESAVATGARIGLRDQGLMIHIRPLNQVSSEIVLVRSDMANRNLVEDLKQELTFV
jgi:hypothetical protein